MEIKNSKIFFFISIIILSISINFTKSFSKLCNTKDLYKFGIKSLCETESEDSISCLKNPRKAYLQCRNGYYNEQNITVQTIDCMEDGQWSEIPIQCIPNYITHSNEFKLLEKNEIAFPTSYIEIVRKNPIENATNVFPGVIIHEKHILTKCEFIQENDHGVDFLIRIYRAKSKPEEERDSFYYYIRRFTHNNESFCVFNINEKYIKYDENIRPSCFFMDIKNNINFDDDADVFLPSYKQKCFVPDVDHSKVEIVCSNEKSILHLETASVDGKTFYGGGKTEFVQEECTEYSDEIIIRCHLGFENVKLKDIHYISYCSKGEWKYQPTESNDCVHVCGDIDPKYDIPLTPLLYKGVETNIISAPWHVGIFANNSANSDSFDQICGGSIVHSNIVISAAHCFYNDAYGKLFDESNYLVGAGKRYRSFDVFEENEFYNEIEQIHIPSTYQAQPIQDDTAILILKHHFQFSSHVKPVCVEWRLYADYVVGERVVGRTFGWGSTSRDGGPSNGLLTIDLLTLTNNQCKKLVNPNLRSQISNDKFCAVNKDNATACRGDSGGGFVIKRGLGKSGYYIIAGVISVGLDVKNYCSSGFLSLFSNIQFHQDFIKTIIQNSRNRAVPRQITAKSSLAFYTP